MLGGDEEDFFSSGVGSYRGFGCDSSVGAGCAARRADQRALAGRGGDVLLCAGLQLDRKSVV